MKVNFEMVPGTAPRSGFSPVLALLLLVGASCSDEPGNTGASQQEASAEAAYLLASRIFSTDGSAVTSYFHVLPSLEAGTEVDPKLALEVPGSARLFAIDDRSWFAIGDGEQPALTRYTLDDTGALVAGERLSLQNYGVADLWDSLYVVSKTKVYYPDRKNHQLIIINPESMQIEGAIALPDTAREGYLAYYGNAAFMRGSTLLFSVGWFDWENNDSVLPETGLVAIDTASDELISFDTDGRCGGVNQPIVLESKEVILASSALAGAVHRLGRLSSKPCALRVAADALTFDPDYALDLGELTGVEIVGEPVPAGGTSIFLRAFDAELGKVEADALSWDLTGQLVWHWLRWDVASGTVSRVAELPDGTADVIWFRVGERVFGSQTTEDYSETTLFELTARGGPEAAVTARGFVHALAQIR